MQGKLRKQKPMPLWRVPLAASTATETNRAAERADIINTAAHAAQHGTLPCEFWLRTRMTTWPHCMSAARVHARRAATVWPLTAASAAWRPRQITRKRIAAGKHASFEATVRGRESIPPESGLAGLTAQAECRQGAGANCVLNVHRVATIPTQPFAW